MLIVSKSKLISVVYEKDDIPEDAPEILSSTQWHYNIYLKLSKEEYKNAFKEVNEYLKDISKEERHQLYMFYYNCMAALTQNKPYYEVVSLINKEVLKIDHIIDIERIRRFNNKRMVFDWLELEKVELIKKAELERTTYSNSQANDLMCMSVVVKILTPVFGRLAQYVAEPTGKEWKEPKVMEILEGTSLSKSEPFLRLMVFCQAKAEVCKNKISSTEKRGLTLEKLQDIVMAIAVVRCLAAFNITGPKNIIRQLFQDITNLLDSVSYTRIRDKGSVTISDGQEEGLAHNWRRSLNSRPVDRAVVIGALKNTKKIASDIGISNHSVKEINALTKELCDSPNKVLPLHIRLIAAAFIVNHKQVISVKMLAIIDDKLALRRAQALAHYLFLEKGYIGLANLLISKYRPMHEEEAAEVMREVIRPLGPEDKEVLLSKYPLINPDRIINKSSSRKHESTPGSIMIEDIVSFIQVNIFETNVSFSNIRHEMLDIVKNL